MSRSETRENLFKLIYERCMNGEKNALTYSMIENATEDEQLGYLSNVYNGVDEKVDILTDYIARFANDFSAERIYKVDLSILLLACYEILYMDDIPDAASINEAVELSKKYSTEKSSAFINGILAGIKKNKEELLNEQREDN